MNYTRKYEDELFGTTKSAVIWHDKTAHAEAEVWAQPSSSPSAPHRFAIVGTRKDSDSASGLASPRYLYRAFLPLCDCTRETLDFARGGNIGPGGKYVAPPEIQLPREVCRRGVAVPNAGRPIEGLRMRDRCPDADGNSRRQLEHQKLYCHGENEAWHAAHVIPVAEAVLDSYAPKYRKPRKPTTVGAPVYRYPTGTVKDACAFAGIDPDEFAKQLAAARGESGRVMTKTKLRALAREARRYGTYYAGPGKAFVFCPLASKARTRPEKVLVVVPPSQKPRAADFDRAVIEHLEDEYLDGEPVCTGRKAGLS